MAYMKAAAEKMRVTSCIESRHREARGVKRLPLEASIMPKHQVFNAFHVFVYCNVGDDQCREA